MKLHAARLLSAGSIALLLCRSCGELLAPGTELIAGDRLVCGTCDAELERVALVLHQRHEHQRRRARACEILRPGLVALRPICLAALHARGRDQQRNRDLAVELLAGIEEAEARDLLAGIEEEEP